MSRRRKLKPKVYEIDIESLSHEGRGISHIDNKVIFTRGALPGERGAGRQGGVAALAERARLLPRGDPGEI